MKNRLFLLAFFLTFTCPPAFGWDMISRQWRLNDPLLARALMLAGADVHQADCLGLSAIFYAADAGDADTVALLLAEGAKADTLPEGLSPLHFAKNAETVNLLVNAGADVNAHGKYVPMTPLMTGEDEGRNLALLAAGADACFRTPDGWTPLHFPHTERVMLALLAAGADADARAGSLNVTPLHLVLPDVYYMEAKLCPPLRCTLELLAMLDSWERLDEEDWRDGGDYCVENPPDREARCRVVSALLAAGASPDAITRTGDAPLHLAVDAPTVKVLLNAGANVHALTLEGYSPLHSAMDVASLELLVAAGADVRHKDNDGWTALHSAKDAACAAWLIEKLKAAGMNPKVFLNEESECGLTVLQSLCMFGVSEYSQQWAKETKTLLDAIPGLTADEAAAYRKRMAEFSVEAMLRVLLDAGADVNRRDSSGNTIAFFARELGTLKLLKGYGADLTLKNDRGETLLINRWHKSPEMVQFLVDEGVDVNAISTDGDLALAVPGISDPVSVKILLAAGANPNPQTLTTQENVNLSLLWHFDPECVRLLIEAGADVGVKDRFGRTALHQLWDSAAKAKLLLAAGADVDARDDLGRTPLFEVLEDLELVKLFIDAGADVNAKDNYGRAPLFPETDYGIRPVYHLDLETVRLLVEAGADPSDGPDGKTLLHMTEDAEVVAYLLERGVDVNARDGRGRTPLFRSEDADRPSGIVRLLLAAGADVHVRDDIGQTSLFRYRGKAVELLLEAGAEVNVQNHSGRYPLHHCRDAEHVRLLVAAGAEVNVKENSGQTPLHFMVNFGHAGCVAALLEAGADVEARENTGKSPLFFYRGLADDPEIGKILLAHGADVNAVDNVLRTPLYHGVARYPIAKWLLEHGAAPNLRDVDGQTPLFNVREREVYRLMLEHGASPDLTDRNGRQAMCVRMFGLDGNLAAEDDEEEKDGGEDDFDEDNAWFFALPGEPFEVMKSFMKAEAIRRGADVKVEGDVVYEAVF